MTNKILVVEDEEAIRGFIKVNLKRNNFDVIEAGSGEEALEKLDDSVDIVLLDVMLPGINGFEVCAKAREAFPQLGVIILTAKGQEENKIEGLEAGADDYIVKPFSPKELLARINALLRRLSIQVDEAGEDAKEITTGIFTMNIDERRAHPDRILPRQIFHGKRQQGRASRRDPQQRLGLQLRWRFQDR